MISLDWRGVVRDVRVSVGSAAGLGDPGRDHHRGVFSPPGTRSGSSFNTSSPWSQASCGASLVSVVRRTAGVERVGDDRGARGGGGGSGRRPVALPGLRRSAGPLGVRSRAAGADARGDLLDQAQAGELPRLRDHTLAAPGMGGAASARRRRGDRRCAAGQCARDGHRRIAARLGRPRGTVRGLRTFARRAEQVSASARRWTHAIDARALDQAGPAASPVVDAVDVLGRMARACRLQLRMSASPWEAGRDAHRPALRPPTRPARVLSELRRAREWVASLARATLEPAGMSCG